MGRYRDFRYLAGIILLTAVYFVAGKLGLRLASINSSASAVWPPTGIALAALLVLGYRFWPAILVGAFLVNLTTAGTVATSIAIALGNTLEGIVGAYLVNRFANGCNAFDRAQNVFKFALFAALFSTTISATIGVTSLSWAGFASWHNYGTIWLTWWLGDMGGALVLAPPLILWSSNSRVRWQGAQKYEVALLFLSVIVIAQVVFGGFIPLTVLSFPVLLWAAFRFGCRETATAVLLLAVFAAWGTVRGLGPFTGATQNESLLLLQMFLAVSAVTALALAALVSRHQRTELALRKAHEKLEHRIQKRTIELSKAVEALQKEAREREQAQDRLQSSEERFRLLVASVKDYAILMLDPEGRVMSWSAGAERIKGYKAEEIIGQHFSRFYTDEDIERGTPERLLKTAMTEGRVAEEGWRLRKDGSRFWADVVITTLRDESGNFRGFVKVTRDVTERREAMEAVRRLNEELQYKAAQLEVANKELESFSYSVSHDLRAPLRSLDGFSQAVLEEYAPKLDENGRNHLKRIRAASQRMGQLIDDLLRLARVTRAELHLQRVELSAITRAVAASLQQMQPDRAVRFIIAEGLVAHGDARLLTVALENLLGNSWKFTANHPQASIEFGVTQRDGKPVFFVRDDGAGFDMNYAGKLFGAFQRLHSAAEFAGTGIGLATVQRIVRRHGGEIWAQGEVEQGATFYFTL